MQLGEGLNSMDGSIFSNDHPDYPEQNNQMNVDKSRNIQDFNPINSKIPTKVPVSPGMSVSNHS